MVKQKFIIAAIVILCGVSSRAIGKVVPNTEFITTIALATTRYMGLRWALGIIISILAISDLLIGNSFIFLFTWSAYLLLAIASSRWIWPKKIKLSFVIQTVSAGIMASVWFFVWTNFGVWLLDSWNMYPKTLTGLADAFILAIPFFKNNLIGNIIFVPVSFIIIEVLFQFQKNKVLQRDKKKRRQQIYEYE